MRRPMHHLVLCQILQKPRPTTFTCQKELVSPLETPAKVPNQGEASQESHQRDPDLVNNCRDETETESFYGTLPPFKEDNNTLRIGFQNIGGLPAEKGKAKDDFLCSGIKKINFDVFGVAEVNINLTWVNEEDRLAYKSRFWWEHSNMMQAYMKSQNRATKQYGGVAMWTLGKSVYRQNTGKRQGPLRFGKMGLDKIQR